MQLSDIVAVLTAVASIGVKVVGLPDQIKTNHRRQSTAGVSSAYFVLAFISYSLWAVDGFLQHDKIVIVAQGLGIFTTGAILWQIFKYRKPGTSHPFKLSHLFGSFDGKHKSSNGINDA